MAKTGKEKAKEGEVRKEQYRLMRQSLIDIVEAEDSTNTEKINAINTIYMIDTEGVPLPWIWECPRVYI